MARKILDKISGYIPGKPVEEVKRALGLREVYKLASNEIPFLPRHTKKAILSELENINRYPEGGCFRLRKALAKKLKVKPEQIVFGNGSDEIIVMALGALVDAGQEVIVAYPTFLIYEIQAKIKGAKVVKVPLKNLSYDLEAIIEKATSRTKIIFIANPDNPTGSYLNHRRVSGFLRKIPKSTIVFLDEAYFEFAPRDFCRSRRLLDKHPNLVFTRTFSKAYGLAGLRIGYGVMSVPLAEAFNKVREPFNINRIAQAAAVAALENEPFLRKVVSYVSKEKDYLYRQLARLDLSFTKSAANFILIDFKKDTRPLYNYLLKRGVIVRTLSEWGMPNFFRVTAGLHKENVKFINTLKQYLGDNE